MNESKRANSRLRRHRCRGSALVEFSVMIPLLLVGIAGAVDFGRVYFDSVNVANAAEAGIMFATSEQSNETNTTGIRNAVLDDFRNAVVTGGNGDQTIDQVSVASERYCECPDGGEVSCDTGTCGGKTSTRRTYVRVQVDKPFHTLFSYPGIPDTIMLTRTVSMRSR